ncbi:MAG: hypothetical protein IJH39_00630 [Clostridia bacterium]|nr:hypothetical protein [Clostridia bacterium]
MEQTRYVNLPMIGRIQHGLLENNRVKELGYFIAKSEDPYMEKYLQKFNELYKGKQCIDIEIFDKEPLSVKYARYNQSGEVCSCMENSKDAKLKVKNGWQNIKCTENCQYRQRNEQGKAQCNRIAWFKFLIPSISKDRIFLMRITGQRAINRLKEYFSFQKEQQGSVKGQYILFLRKEEQRNILGQTFNNYILDIMKKDFNQVEKIPDNQENNQNVSTINAQNVNNTSTNVKNSPPNVVTEIDTKNNNSKEKIIDESNVAKEEQNAESKKGKATTKKKSKSKKSVENQEGIITENKGEIASISPEQTSNENIIDSENTGDAEDTDDVNKYFVLESTYTEMIADKQGLEKPYLIGKFHDYNENIIDIAIKPEDSEELQKCDIGTLVKIDIHEALNKKFAVKLEYVNKIIKKVAA